MEYHIEGSDKDFDLVLTEYKEIPLTQDKVALIDVEDYEELNKFKWHTHREGNTYYVIRHIKKNGKNTMIRMHREIMNTPKGIDTDHINGHGWDNRVNNLRICTKSQNSANRGKQENNISGFKGVTWNTQKKKWMAQIQANRKYKNLGYFSIKEEAAIVYNEAAKKYHGEFAKLNHII